MKGIELEKAYNPQDFEDRLYERWEKEGYFKPASDKDSPVHKENCACCGKTNTYSVVIPPPNVTGVLHMGHGLNNTLQDIVVRYHRMKGDNTLWLTGTDHAGIATQNVVERQLKKEGLTRNDGSMRRNVWDGLGFLRFLNVNLAILNLLPIPVLDGGLIIFALIAMVFRRRVPEKIVRWLSMAFMVLLMGLMAILIMRDAYRSFRIHTYDHERQDQGAEVR